MTSLGQDPLRDGDLASLLEQARGVSESGMSVARISLLDFLALLVAFDAMDAKRPRLLDGTSSTAAFMASAVSAGDLDDVDWSGPHHPGSVVWSAVLAVASRQESPGDRVLSAGAIGYQVAAQAAALLGPDHARHWHLTSTAGAIGGAAAAAHMAGLTEDGIARSVAFALLNAGGLGQAPLERTGTARMTRAAAAALGVVSAGMSVTEVPTLALPWTGPRGAAAVIRAREPGGTAFVDPWESVGLRLYPVNGFVHAAVAASAELAPADSSTVTQIVWRLPAGALTMVGDADHGDWWNGRLAAARAVGTRSAFLADRPGSWDALADRVRLEPADIPMGDAHVSITNAGEEKSTAASRHTIALDASSTAHVNDKCRQVLGVDFGTVNDLLDEILSPTPDWPAVRTALSL